MTKDRQRWQPEEDSLLCDYVQQFGPRDWNLIPQRMGRALNRDPKSCLERWKNYLRPGLKKGSLSPEEQSLVIALQSQYGNKWKAIAAHLPGRTPKRLGKWWEVYKEKQMKLTSNVLVPAQSGTPSAYEHIIQTFTEKHVMAMPLAAREVEDATVHVPVNVEPSVALTLSPPRVGEIEVGVMVRMCEEVEEARKAWEGERKEAKWRMRRLEVQLEAEKRRRVRAKAREVEEMVRVLKDEEREFGERIERDFEKKLQVLRNGLECDEEEERMKMVSKHEEVLKGMQRLCFASGSQDVVHSFFPGFRELQ